VSTTGVDPDELDDEWADKIVRLPRSERVEALFNFEPVEPYQTELLDNPAQKKVVNWGRRSGKTVTAGALAADRVLRVPDEDVAILAPYMETAKEMFSEVKDHLEALGMHGVVGVETDNKITWEISNGARLIARTLGSEAQRGKGPSCIIIDEAAIVAGDTITKIVRPMTITHQNYELILMSTPRGQQGYYFEKWNDDNWWSTKATCWDNPYAIESILKEIREEEDDLTWRQEYLAEFVEPGNVYLPTELVAPCMPGRHDNVEDPRPVQTERGVRRWLGVDPAGAGQDRAVYTSVDEIGRVFDVTSWAKQTTPEAKGQIEALEEKFGYEAILVDKNAIGEGVVQFGQLDVPHIEPVPFTSESKQSLYKTLRRVFEEEALLLPNNERLFSETTSLVYDYTQSGILRVDHPPGGHDDYPDSLALAVYGWQTDVTGGSNGVEFSTRSGASAGRSSRSRNRGSSRRTR